MQIFYISYLKDFFSSHPEWIIFIIFLLTFSESLVFVSLFVPGTGILAVTSFFLRELDVSVFSFWGAAVFGSICGYTLSYQAGVFFEERIMKSHFFQTRQAQVERAHALAEKYGAAGVFIGHFFGPVRAFIPFVAGVAGLRFWKFEIANLTSAFLWATIIIAPGFFATHEEAKTFFSTLFSRFF